MGLSSKIYLDVRYTKRDGSQAIKIRVTIDRKPIEIPTGYSVEPKYWNAQAMRIKSNCPTVKNVTRLNNMLRTIQVSLEDKVIQLQQNGEIKNMSLKQLKAHLMDRDIQDHFVLSYCNQVIAQISASGRAGNAQVYRTLYMSLKNYLEGQDIPMKSISFKWLKSYETWYLSKGNSINGLSFYMRTLRAVLKRALKERIITNETYPFDEYSIRQEKTKKRAMTAQELDAFKNFVPTSQAQEKAKDYFLMSFYMMGASFIDLVHLRMNNIQNGRIEYKRKKTGQQHSIKITDPLQVIIDRYTNGKINNGQNPYILNVIHSDDPEKQRRQAKGALKPLQ